MPEGPAQGSDSARLGRRSSLRGPPPYSPILTRNKKHYQRVRQNKLRHNRPTGTRLSNAPLPFLPRLLLPSLPRHLPPSLAPSSPLSSPRPSLLPCLPFFRFLLLPPLSLRPTLSVRYVPPSLPPSSFPPFPSLPLSLSVYRITQQKN